MPIGTPRRGVYLKWLFFGPSVFEPAMIDRAFPRKEGAKASSLGWRGFDEVLDIVAKAIAPGPWLMGEQFTAADMVIGANIRWGISPPYAPVGRHCTCEGPHGPRPGWVEHR